MKIREPNKQEARDIDDHEADHKIAETEAWLEQAKKQGASVVWDPSALATYMKRDDDADSDI
jgi:hypothetical protein